VSGESAPSNGAAGRRRPPVGVCVVRAEPRGAHGLLVVVTTNPDIRHVSGESSRRVGDIPAALAIVAEFLATWAGDRETQQ